jgi:hypothetical protein
MAAPTSRLAGGRFGSTSSTRSFATRSGSSPSLPSGTGSAPS